MAWLDNLDPNTPQGMQFAGLLGGFNQLGAGLLQAGASRPVGQAGPGLGEALMGFGQGQRAGLQGAMQQAQMQRQMSRQALLGEARSNKPDDQISPEARAMRSALSSLPENVRALADSEQLPGLVVQRETQRQRPMTAQELAAAGYRPGTVAYTSDWTGGANISQQPDVMSPEAFAQKARLTALGRAPTVTWQDVRDSAGNIIGQRSNTGQYQPINAPAMNPGQAMTLISQLGPRVADGTIRPGTPEFERYTAAYTVATESKTEYVPNPNQPGMLMPVTRPRMMLPQQFPNPATLLGAQGAPAPGGAPPAPVAPQAAPGGVPIAPGGPVAEPPPPGAQPTPAASAAAARATPQQATLLQKGEEEAVKLKAAIDNFNTVLARNGAGLSTYMNNPRDPKAQEVLGAFERLKMVMRSEGLLNTGVLQPGEVRMLDDMLLNPQTIRGALATPDAYKARLGQFEKQVLDFYNVRRVQAGLPPLERIPGAPGDAGGGAGAATMRWNPQTQRVEPVR